MDALRLLINELRANYPALTRPGFVAHRWIAVDTQGNYGRKTDPTDLTDNWLKNWITSL